MMSFKKLTGLFVVLLFLVSCNSRLAPKEYLKWIQDYKNELHVLKNEGEYSFDLQYEPLQYKWLLQQDEASLTQIPDFQKDSLSDIQYYLLTIGLQNKDIDVIDYGLEDISQKQQKLYYFSYEFEHHINLEEGSKVLPCILFHFEKPLDLKPSRTFILGFENPFKDSKEATLVIQSEYFGALPIKIKVKKNNIPELKI
jgi:hypothetical protein